jgi:hypothetical protein
MERPFKKLQDFLKGLAARAAAERDRERKILALALMGNVYNPEGWEFNI